MAIVRAKNLSESSHGETLDSPEKLNSNINKSVKRCRAHDHHLENISGHLACPGDTSGLVPAAAFSGQVFSEPLTDIGVTSDEFRGEMRLSRSRPSRDILRRQG